MAEDGQPVVRLPSPGSHDKPAEEAKPEPVEEPKPEPKQAAKKTTSSKERTS